MSILTSIRRQAQAWQAPKVTVKAVSDYRPDLRYREHMNSGRAGEAGDLADSFVGNASVYQVYGWVRKAVSLTATNIAGLPVRVVDAQGEAVDNHPVTVLLSAGNDTMSAAAVWESYAVSMLLAGEAFLEIVPDKRNAPLWLWPRRPDRTFVHPDTAPERRLYPIVAGYSVTPETADGSTPVMLDPAMMIHDKFVNPLNPWRGLSVIGAVRSAIVIDMYAQAWSKLFLRRNARPDYAVIAPQGITQTERDRIQADLMFQFGGTENWHKPIVLEDGVTDIRAFSFPPKDIEWLQQREKAQQEVGAIFGVPDELMGFGKDTYENFNTALTVFWTLTLRPLVQHRDISLTHHFTTRNRLLQPGQRIETDLSTVGALQEDKQPKVEMAVKLWNIGVPFNQLDEQLQLTIGPVPNGEYPFGKDPAAAEAMRQAIAGQSNANRPPADDNVDDNSVDNAADQGGQLDDMDGDNADKGAATAHGFFIKGVTGFTREAWVEAKALVLQTVPGDDDAEEALRREVERAAEAAIIAGFRQQRRAMIPPGAREMELNALLAAMAAGVSLSVALHDAITRTVITGADLGVNVALDQLASVGASFDYTLVNQYARTWAAQYSSTLIRDIDAHTLSYVRQAVERWYTNGEPLTALRADLEPIFSAYRAQMIAETETTRSAAEGALRGYRESGVVEAMEWSTVLDERVCPVCGSLHGARVSLSGAFWDTLEPDLQQRYRRTFQVPPAHPRCRCRLRPVVMVRE
jgi:HK97 family phage portal protein